MRRLVAVAVVVMMVGAGAGAQRGGARGGGGGGGMHGGGFAGHAAGGSRGGFAQAGPSRNMGGARVQGFRNSGGAVGAPYRSAGNEGARPRFYERGQGDRDRGRDGRRDRDRREGFGYGYVGPLNYGWLDSGFLDDGDYGGYADPGDGYADDGNGYGAVAPNGPGDGGDPGNYAENYAGQQSAEAEQSEPEPEGSQQLEPVARMQPAAPTQQASDPVTLVFRDGRPMETIHNYALTRTTLYVMDRRHREIAVADLDLAATVKANRAAGVTFELPQGQ